MREGREGRATRGWKQWRENSIWHNQHVCECWPWNLLQPKFGFLLRWLVSIYEVTCKYECCLYVNTYSTSLLSPPGEYHSQPGIEPRLLFLSASCQNHPTATRSFCLPEILLSFFLLSASPQHCSASPPPASGHPTQQVTLLTEATNSAWVSFNYLC